MAQSQLFITNRVVLGAAGRGTITLQAGEGDTFKFRYMAFQATGAFSLMRIRSSSGKEYLSDQNGNGIPSVLFARTEFNIQEFGKLMPEVEITPAELLYIEVLDTSGAGNTVTVVLTGEREY